MNQQLTVGGIIIFAFVLWTYGINGSPDMKKTINMFLFVLLMSIIILRWETIRPFIIKDSIASKADEMQTGGTRA